jgi:transposase
VDTTPTGSELLYATTAPRRIFHRKETQRQCASAPRLYRARNLVERFFNKIKHCRRVAIRYEKLAANYLAFVQLASIRLRPRVNESTT